MTDSEKLDLLLNQMGAMDKRFTQMDERFTQMDERFTRMDERFTQMDERFTQLDNRLMNVESGVTDIRLTLENEIRPNIRRVAEGHLDLSRKLDEALKVENEKEMLIIRVNTLENELRRMKDKINSFA